MRAQDNTEGVARPIVVRLFLWLACTFQWKYEVNVSHADLADRLSVKTSRPSCNQDDAGLDRNPIWSAEDKRITALMPVDTAEAQKAQNQVLPRKLLRRTATQGSRRQVTAIAFNPPNLQ